MSKFMWRQYRTQIIVSSILALGIYVLFFAMGLHMRHLLHHAQQACASTYTCDSVEGSLFNGTLYAILKDLANLSVAVPIIIGLFFGVTLFGKELEDGTHKLAWTQSVTRARWITVKVFWSVLFVVVLSGLWVLVINYWAAPVQKLGNPRFQTIEFDTRGIVPVAYAVFATSLGVLFGVLWRRILPAVASLLGAFLVIRLFVELAIRPHYMTPMQHSVPLEQPDFVNGWVLSDKIVSPTGTPLHLISPDFVFQMCGPPTDADGKGSVFRCLGQHGYREVMKWQPDNRFWTFQGIEFAIFIVLSALILSYACVKLAKSDS